MVKNVHQRVDNNSGYHWLNLKHDFWRGYVLNMTTVTICSTRTQITINDFFVIKNSTICQLLFVIRPVLWLVSTG